MTWWSRRAWARASKLGMFVGAIALGGCGGDAKPVPRGLLGPDGQPLSPAAGQAPPAAPRPAPPPQFQPLPSAFDPKPAVDPGALMASPAQAAPAAASPAKPARDLAIELARLVPAPSQCLDLARAASQGELTISVSATASPSGQLSNVVVSAPGQSPESIRCLQRGVATGALAPDVPDAPVQVQANLSIEVLAEAAPPPPAQPARPAEPALPPPSPSVAQPENGEVAKPDGTEFAQPSQ